MSRTRNLLVYESDTLPTGPLHWNRVAKSEYISCRFAQSHRSDSISTRERRQSSHFVKEYCPAVHTAAGPLPSGTGTSRNHAASATYINRMRGGPNRSPRDICPFVRPSVSLPSNLANLHRKSVQIRSCSLTASSSARRISVRHALFMNNAVHLQDALYRPDSNGYASSLVITNDRKTSCIIEGNQSSSVRRSLLNCNQSFNCF